MAHCQCAHPHTLVWDVAFTLLDVPLEPPPQVDRLSERIKMEEKYAEFMAAKGLQQEFDSFGTAPVEAEKKSK